MITYSDPNNENLQRVIAELQNNYALLEEKYENSLEYVVCMMLSDDDVERFALFSKMMQEHYELNNRMLNTLNNKVPDIVRQYQKMKQL